MPYECKKNKKNCHFSKELPNIVIFFQKKIARVKVVSIYFSVWPGKVLPALDCSQNTNNRGTQETNRTVSMPKKKKKSYERTIVSTSNIEIKMQFPMLFRHRMYRTAKLLVTIYNITVHENKINVALNVEKIIVGM